MDLHQSFDVKTNALLVRNFDFVANLKLTRYHLSVSIMTSQQTATFSRGYLSQATLSATDLTIGCDQRCIIPATMLGLLRAISEQALLKKDE